MGEKIISLVETSLADSNTSSPSVNPREIVNKHNDLRRGVQPTATNMLKMSWSKEFAANAQRWADRCTLNHTPAPRKLGNKKFGENLYMSGGAASWDMAIQKWYDEVKRWKYGRGGSNVGHFTQIVWANSNLIGCGMAICPKAKYKYYYVCQYSPP
ncbi:cysteine-rich venom protein TEL1-like [Pagrus major]|uniref:cysteine-rich venom protein TEL1-like n=1 Tax=Pagrus major TaxID=143350 RepID=UPI003CC88EC3